MSDDPKAPRSTWTQANVLALAHAYQHGGLPAAAKAFPDRSPGELSGKLEALGLLRLTDAENANIVAFVKVATESSHPALFRRHAIAALRKSSKGDAA